MKNMAPPEAPVGDKDHTTDMPSAASVCLHVLKKRADFLLAARAGWTRTTGMTVQARKRPSGEAVGIRVGFTCSKKVGNAVARNRAKRRLREVARLVLTDHGRDGWDYVLIGKPDDTANRPFEDLKGDLIYALRKLHDAPPRR